MARSTTAWVNGLGQKLALAGVLQDAAKQSNVWNFVSGVTAVWNETEGRWDLTFSGGGGGGHTIEDEGVALTQRTSLNFVGVNVSVADSGGKTVVTIGAVSLAGSGVTGTLPITRGGTGLGTLGTALQSLRVNAGATALEYYTPSAGLSAPVNPTDDGKVAVAAAGNLTYALLTNAHCAAGMALAKTKIENSGPCSVVGHSANSTGALADITASADGQVLRRSGGALSFGAIAGAGMPQGAVIGQEFLWDGSAWYLVGRKTGTALTDASATLQYTTAAQYIWPVGTNTTATRTLTLGTTGLAALPLAGLGSILNIFVLRSLSNDLVINNGGAGGAGSFNGTITIPASFGPCAISWYFDGTNWSLGGIETLGSVTAA